MPYYLMMRNNRTIRFKKKEKKTFKKWSIHYKMETTACNRFETDVEKLVSFK